MHAQVPRARMLLAKARSGSGAQYPRVWMKSAIVERELGKVSEVRLSVAVITCGTALWLLISAHVVGLLWDLRAEWGLCFVSA